MRTPPGVTPKATRVMVGRLRDARTSSPTLTIAVTVLRRGGEAPTSARHVAFGLLRIDRDAHRVWVGESELELTALEFKLLCTLHDRKNRVQSRAALLSDVWGIEADITTRTVDTHVRRLRKKLGEVADYVQTLRGVGYRFTTDLRDSDEEP